jgi:hypothetical protein
MKYNLMPLRPFNQRRAGSSEVLYLFPLPHGERCVIETNGTEITVHTENGDDLTGFSPDVRVSSSKSTPA